MVLFMSVITVFQLLLTCYAEDEVYDFWSKVGCDEMRVPDNCDLQKIPLLTVEDISRCAPATLPPYARNFYLGWSGRGVTYRENKKAFGDIFIKGRMLRDISNNNLEVTTLGQKVSFPVGIAPVAIQNLAHPDGEIATVAAAAEHDTVMILSSYSSHSLEAVAEKVRGRGGHLWLQVYIFKNREVTIDIVRRAEQNGFKALVLTADTYFFPMKFCDAGNDPNISGAKLGNAPFTFGELQPAPITFFDIAWLKSISKLPIIAKGIITGEDAVIAMRAGASAVIVSNHGGRQLDGVPASINSLFDVVRAVKNTYPFRDVYMDGGIRNGFDVFKAIAAGAKMVFIGRPVLWGLALEGEKGVKRVLKILKKEFNETMTLSGHKDPSQISSQDIISSCYTFPGK